MGTPVFSRRAEQDLLEIWVYIAADDIDAADRQIDRIFNSCQMLADHPEAGVPRTRLRKDMRSFAVGSYLILHRAVTAGVEIVRIMHGARDIGSNDLD